MNAIRPDEELDGLHSIYVDQWDRERTIEDNPRTVEFLQAIVRKIYRVPRRTEAFICDRYPELGTWLPETITFVHAEDLEARYPGLSPAAREHRVAAEHGAVFIIGIGAALPGAGTPHDGRAPDCHDWMTPSGRYFHRTLLGGALPASIGGGVGQSRLCTYYLPKAHVGEVRVGIRPVEMAAACRARQKRPAASCPAGMDSPSSSCGGMLIVPDAFLSGGQDLLARGRLRQPAIPATIRRPDPCARPPAVLTMSVVTKAAVVTADQAGRVDNVVRALTGRSRSQVRGMIDHGRVCINGNPVDSDSEMVSAGDSVDVRYDPAQGYPEKPKARAGSPFKILFEDNDLLVVDKAAHLLTVPTPRREKDTLVHLLQQYVSAGRRRLGRVEIVHRLDRGVSGVLVFAKSARVAALLRDQFSEHKPEREYVAIVAGRVAANPGTFAKNIADNSRTLQRYCPDHPGAGESAVTHYEVIKRFSWATMVKVWLETGRRNQIRVHFADAGHPVLGDPRYGGNQAKHPRWQCRRMALHACSLSLTHPVNGRPVRFKSPLPREFQECS